MLLSFVWTLAGLTLVAEKKYGVKVIGTVTMPVAIVGVVLMQLLRTEVHPHRPGVRLSGETFGKNGWITMLTATC